MKINDYLGKTIKVVVDRKLGTKHPKHKFIYDVNYGYIPETVSGDGEEIDVYLLGINRPVTKGEGKCIAIIHRIDDDDDKLIVSAGDQDFSDDEIEKLTKFQEKWFKHIIIRK